MVFLIYILPLIKDTPEISFINSCLSSIERRVCFIIQ